MEPGPKPTFVWESVYRATLDGRPFPWEIRSQMALRVGHAFFLPLKKEVMVNPAFARPIWKPRSRPNFVRVQVERVDGETLVLRSLKPPVSHQRWKVRSVSEGRARAAVVRPVAYASHFL